MKIFRGYCKVKRGFTLVEIIVVITIVVTLISLVGPSTIGYLDMAEEVANKSTARAVYIASMQAMAEAAMSGDRLESEDDIKRHIIEAELLQGNAETILVDVVIDFEVGTSTINYVEYLGEFYPDGIATE